MSRKRLFQPHYSGDRSRAFWRVVNGTGDPDLYAAGCELQSLEAVLLARVNGAEQCQYEWIPTHSIRRVRCMRSEGHGDLHESPEGYKIGPSR